MLSQPVNVEPQTNGHPVFKLVAECLYRHSETGKYYALVKRKGKQHRKSLKTTDRQLADRKLAAFRDKIGRSVAPTRDRNTTFKELAQDWFGVAKTRLKPRSAESAECCLNQLNKHFGILPVRNITTGHCREWEKNRGANVSASSFNHDRTQLIAVLDFAVKEGLMLENPALTIARRKLPKGKIVIPSKDDFTLLVKTMRDCNPAKAGADLVELLAYSGMRLSEATALTWGDIDFERGQFAVTGGVHGTKNHETRVVPLFPALRLLLERLKTEHQKEIIPNEPVSEIGSAKKAMANACKKAKLPHFHHHLLRHFFVSQAIEAGVDFKTISAWVGHKDGGVLVARTYGHLRDAHSAEMAKRMTFSAAA
ncbi:MAG TPA: tyrosine-type recombinase/integrase [Candidatus Angelobacter sp.]|nr:tyrosine-type recombinase/integrase [Candidatus Angelobacter sp.]